MPAFSVSKPMAALVLSISLLSCNQGADTGATNTASAPGAAPAVTQSETLRQAASTVRRYLANRQFDSLQRYTPGSSAILFAPYGFIDEPASQKLTARQLATLAQSREQKVWGTYDAIGGDIRLDVPAYFAKFVNDKNYGNADSVKVNQIVRIGQIPSNLEKTFPGAEYVEYFCKGAEQYGGLDFGQLRLVFKQTSTGYQLLAVVHNEMST